MKPLLVLRDYLGRNSPQALYAQNTCTCGESNHARVRFLRVDGLPAAIVLSETAPVSLEDIRLSLRTNDVELLPDSELDAIFADTELGHTQPFENPFGGSVYLDACLLTEEDLVFCPRMFFGQLGHECFRASLHEFLKLTHARIVPLTVAGGFAEQWIV